MNEKKCEGCGTYYDTIGEKCHLITFNDECPCIECLIKSMCGEGCDTYNNFYDKCEEYIAKER